MKHQIKLRINGANYEASVEPRRTLLDLLRYDLGLVGTHEGCGMGQCGSCLVLLDGKPILSCLTLALDANERDLLTIEGLAQGEKLDPIQEAFINTGAIQCGFCTPGMILAAKALLNENPKPDENQIRDAISGNLCRCTGYVKIIKAIQSASLTT